jgi:tripartite-type tricarboxylate transporter receptor subunit TctC
MSNSRQCSNANARLRGCDVRVKLAAMHTIQKIALIVCAATAFATAPPLFAQRSPPYPTKPIRIVTGAAGSQNDLVTRMLAAKMSEGLGQSIVVDNRAGAGGAIGANTVAKAAADGYTLLLQSGQFAIRAAVQTKLPYDSLKDFAGISQVGYSTQVLVVSPGLGAKSVRDFIAIAKARPEPMLFSSVGIGSGTHMDAERFRIAAGINARSVAFKGSPEALIEVIAGRAHFSAAPLGSVLPLVKEGKLMALAVYTPQRSPLLPDAPAMPEVLPGYQRDGSYGLMVPAGTPRPILNLLNKEVRRIVELPDVKEQMRNMGFVPSTSTPEELDKIVRADIEAYIKVAKLIGLRAQ